MVRFFAALGRLAPLGVPAEELDASHEEALRDREGHGRLPGERVGERLVRVLGAQLAASTLEAFAMKKVSVTNALGLMATIAPMTARMDQLAAICPKPCMKLSGMIMNIAPMNSPRQMARDAGCGMVPRAFWMPMKSYRAHHHEQARARVEQAVRDVHDADERLAISTTCAWTRDDWYVFGTPV